MSSPCYINIISAIFYNYEPFEVDITFAFVDQDTRYVVRPRKMACHAVSILTERKQTFFTSA